MGTPLSFVVFLLALFLISLSYFSRVLRSISYPSCSTLKYLHHDLVWTQTTSQSTKCRKRSSSRCLIEYTHPWILPSSICRPGRGYNDSLASQATAIEFLSILGSLIRPSSSPSTTLPSTATTSQMDLPRKPVRNAPAPRRHG